MQGLNEVRARCLKTPRLHSGVIPPDQTTSFRRGHDFGRRQNAEDNSSDGK